jgi:hypothetical protein
MGEKSFGSPGNMTRVVWQFLLDKVLGSVQHITPTEWAAQQSLAHHNEDVARSRLLHVLGEIKGLVACSRQARGVL